MIKQKGLPTFFFTLFCADLRWSELIDIITKLGGIDITDAGIDYFRRCELLNQNPVLTARYYQYRVETFFKEIIWHKNGPFQGKVENSVIKVDFLAGGSPHNDCFLWCKDAPDLNTTTKDEYIQFVDSIISADLPDKDHEPELFNF